MLPEILDLNKILLFGDSITQVHSPRSFKSETAQFLRYFKVVGLQPRFAGMGSDFVTRLCAQARRY